MVRSAYVISDLHLGGEDATAGSPGFRMCHQVDLLADFITDVAAGNPAELIINGDFVDFLAERDGDGSWTPVELDAAAAAERLRRIAEVRSDRVVFAALRRLLDADHALTIILGNHDVELSYPAVRATLLELLGPRAARGVRFVVDGEAYVVGSALIEHGNRYDGFNVVDHDGLREIRSLQSRRQRWRDDLRFEPPIGSQLVAEIMNPLKERYPFIDLLKPEDGAVLPLLLAIEPSCRAHLLRILGMKMRAARHEPRSPGEPRRRGEVAAISDNDPVDQLAPLLDILGDAELDDIPDEPPAVQRRGEVANIAAERSRWDWALGVAELFARGGQLGDRLPALLRALRTLRADRSFATDQDDSAYARHAEAIAANGFAFVVFGHTHLAKSVRFEHGSTYLNTGTWCDLIQLPEPLFSGSDSDALAGLEAFVTVLLRGPRDSWVTRRPTYAKIDVDGAATRAALHMYKGSL